MLQIIQYQKTGAITIEELPKPTLKGYGVIVKNVYSVISSGTERMSVETAKASLIGKAKSRPDLVKQVLDNIKREGIKSTYEKIMNRLNNYKKLGYSSAGIVIDTNCEEFNIGDRVACAGGGYASHAEIIFVPKNLVTKIPDNVSFEEAAFTTLGAIALQGVRQANPRLGENVAVIGLGLLGLITVQLLKANGCRVIGLDISDNNFELAKKFGCDLCLISSFEAVKSIESFTKGYGTDAVIITTSTKSNEPIELSLEMARKKSKIVIVGVTGMNIPRNNFYEKELEITIACSYGPGRYDLYYEEKGIDYPIGYVRWTENRNMQAILDLLSSKKLDFKSLITHRFNIDEAFRAYDLITGKIKEKNLGILIHYPNDIDDARKLVKIEIQNNDKNKILEDDINVGFIGAGNFAQSYLLPVLKKLKVNLTGVITAEPINCKSVGEKFGFNFGSTDVNSLLNDDKTSTVFIASRHDTHGKYVIESLKANKNVFVEKPLAINYKDLEEIIYIYNSLEIKPIIAVGFNRRFSKAFNDIKSFFSNSLEPYLIIYRIHAGFIPKTHWVQDPAQGGRIIGEVCHFIDTIQFLTGEKPISVVAQKIDSSNSQITEYDNVAIIIKFDKGSVGNIQYLANGDSSVDKEYCEVYSGGKTAIMNNFKEVDFYSDGKKKKIKYDGRKGHREEVESFINTIMGKSTNKLEFESLVLTTLTTFKILESLQTNSQEKITF